MSKACFSHSDRARVVREAPHVSAATILRNLDRAPLDVRDFPTPSLRGTPKQCKWAGDIRHRRIQEIGFLAVLPEHVYDLISDHLSWHCQASYWIHTRGLPTATLVETWVREASSHPRD